GSTPMAAGAVKLLRREACVPDILNSCFRARLLCRREGRSRQLGLNGVVDLTGLQLRIGLLTYPRETYRSSAIDVQQRPRRRRTCPECHPVIRDGHSDSADGCPELNLVRAPRGG